ncbi:MAG: hypothetical protein ABSB88_09200 [Bryobacteraceae bacterium]
MSRRAENFATLAVCPNRTGCLGPNVAFSLYFQYLAPWSLKCK